jgi:DNA-binding MarR family transcriptional regulator
MLLTAATAEERVFQYVRQVGQLHATDAEIARQTGCDPQDTRHALDELVQRNLLRRFDVPGERPVYWS